MAFSINLPGLVRILLVLTVSILDEDSTISSRCSSRSKRGSRKNLHTNFGRYCVAYLSYASSESRAKTIRLISAIRIRTLGAG